MPFAGQGEEQGKIVEEYWYYLARKPLVLDPDAGSARLR